MKGRVYMERNETAALIRGGEAVFGLELGSTRIKAVLIGPHGEVLASGSYDWENRLEQGVWTYHMDDVWHGIQESYKNLAASVEEKYGEKITHLKALGFSAMMHGYLAFDREGELLVPFRTWRNTMTEEAAADLTSRFGFNIPQRWSIAHLHQAILNNEPHVKDIAFITTLAGYVHWKLTGEKVLGIGDASGMFPIDSEHNVYDSGMMDTFDILHKEHNLPWRLRDILPQIRLAGEDAGELTDAGALLLDPTGTLKPGAPLCPPEGDAGTGMTATNSVRVRTGNISAGTSVFAMIVLEKALSKVHTEIDMVTTPTGKPVAMVHCNNCTSDINAWAGLFKSFAELIGAKCSMPQALDTMFFEALKGDADCGGLVSCNYFSGEPITGMEEGRPLFMRLPDSAFTIQNFARTQLYSAMATLKIGMDILIEKEHAEVDSLLGHGGFFKAKGVGQKLMAGALHTPVSVMETAGEGGPWGMALLASYLVNAEDGETLELRVGRRHIQLRIGSYCVTSRLLEGEFLDYRAAIPKSSTTEIVVSTREFISSVERVSLLITDRLKSPLRCRFEGNEIHLSCSTAIGRASYSFSAAILGDAVEMGFNNRYLLDALRNSEGDEVRLQLNGPLSPMKVLPREGEDYLFLVLPVRLKTD